MGGKHLKKLRAEKSKIKLKQKKAEKGQNVTNTTFKVKKIITYKQLRKKEDNEPVSSWNLALKDLLNRLSHYNCSAKTNSLAGLKELIHSRPDVLEGPSFRNIFTKVLALLIDIEKKVRVAAIDLLQDIFRLLPSNSFKPYMNLLNVHLACAMTHREIAIQQDSLVFMGTILNYAPEVIRQNFLSIFQNFIRIINSHKYGHHSQLFFSKKSQKDMETLAIDTFDKFFRFFNVFYGISQVKDDSNLNNFEIESSLYRFDLKSLRRSFTETPDLSSLFKKSMTSSNVIIEVNASELKTQASLIMPVLFDTWKELSPSKEERQNTSESFLTNIQGKLLLNILEIILLIFENIVKLKDSNLENFFMSNYKDSFTKTFVWNFPYFPKLESNETNSNAFIKQNILIFYLSYYFKIKNDNMESKLDKYIIDFLESERQVPSDILSKVAEVAVKTEKKEIFERFVTAAVQMYHSTRNPDIRKSLFKILIRIVMSNSNINLLQNKLVTNWVRSLFEDLLKEIISLDVVESILNLVNKEDGKELLAEIEKNALKIILNLPNIIVEGLPKLKGQKLVFNILYRCGIDTLIFIKRTISEKESYPSALRDYLNEMISYKEKTEKSS